MNMGGYGCGNNYAFGSSIANLFSDVSGINCLFNYGGCGSYGYSNSGCGCSGNNSVNWGHIMGTIAAWLLPAVGGAIMGGVQNSKASEAQADQGFKKALKTLGYPENTKPENISMNDLQKDFDTAKPEYKQAVDEAGTDDKLQPGGKDETGWESELTTLNADLKNLQKELTNLKKNLPEKPKEDDADYATKLAAYNKAKVDIENKENDIEKKQTEINEANANKKLAYDNKVAYDKAVKAYDKAKTEYEEAQTLAINYLKEWQKQALDDADGTKASRSRAKQVKLDTGENKNENDYGNIANYDKYDWQKLLYAYRTGNSNVQNKIKEFLSSNLPAIKNSTTITTDQEMLLKNVLGISLS